MTSNFTETSISKNAKREYSPIASLTAFEAAVALFTSDDTMNIDKKTLSDTTYKARIDYSTADGDERGYALIYMTDKDSYDSMIDQLMTQETCDLVGGEGGKSVHSPTQDAWSQKFSCAIGEDTFTVTITREYINLNGFANDATLQALETWADTVEALGGEVA